MYRVSKCGVETETDTVRVPVGEAAGLVVEEEVAEQEAVAWKYDMLEDLSANVSY